MTAGWHHFFTDPALVGPQRLVLQGPEAHHAAKVLRVRVGETISVADGTGRVFDAVVTRSEPTEVEARIILAHELRPHRPLLNLWQGLAKREAMDLLVQKAVELGARRIVPFTAERSVVRWDETKRERNLQRWDAIALSAAKQSRSPWITTVHPVREGLTDLDPDAGFVLALHERSDLYLRDALPQAIPHSVSIVIGPEGGLTDQEVDAVQRAGGVAVTLGDRILRTSTAGPVAMALVAYTYGVLG